MALYVCPMCGSTDVYPVYAKDDIWKCNKCGYTGRVQKIEGNLEYFWENYLSISSTKRANLNNPIESFESIKK